MHQHYCKGSRADDIPSAWSADTTRWGSGQDTERSECRGFTCHALCALVSTLARSKGAWDYLDAYFARIFLRLGDRDASSPIAAASAYCERLRKDGRRCGWGGPSGSEPHPCPAHLDSRYARLPEPPNICGRLISPVELMASRGKFKSKRRCAPYPRVPSHLVWPRAAWS